MGDKERDEARVMSADKAYGSSSSFMRRDTDATYNLFFDFHSDEENYVSPYALPSSGTSGMYPFLGTKPLFYSLTSASFVLVSAQRTSSLNHRTFAQNRNTAVPFIKSKGARARERGGGREGTP